MLNMICITGAELAAKAKEAGIVVLIGVVMVFVILALLIGVVQLLKYLNSWMNVWDAHMIYVRERKGEVKKIKVANSDRFSLELNTINSKKDSGEMTSEQAEKALAVLAADKAKAKLELVKQKRELNIKYDTVFNIVKETNFRVKKLIKAEKEEYKQARSLINGDDKKNQIEALKSARILKKVELDDQIKIEEKERDARTALAKVGLPVPANENHSGKILADNQLPEVTDGKVIAAITAAITMILSEDGVAKKAAFRVRSIKLVK